jgi:hypothetical protein
MSLLQHAPSEIYELQTKILSCEHSEPARFPYSLQPQRARSIQNLTSVYKLSPTLPRHPPWRKTLATQDLCESLLGGNMATNENTHEGKCAAGPSVVARGRMQHGVLNDQPTPAWFLANYALAVTTSSCTAYKTQHSPSCLLLFAQSRC